MSPWAAEVKKKRRLKCLKVKEEEEVGKKGERKKRREKRVCLEDERPATFSGHLQRNSRFLFLFDFI